MNPERTERRDAIERHAALLSLDPQSREIRRGAESWVELAEFLDGILGAALHMLAIRVTTWANPAIGPAGERHGWRQRGAAIVRIWDVFALFLLVLSINLKGAFNCSKAVVRSMMKQRYGRIVNISSVSGQAGQVGQTNYSASKAGLIGFTKSVAREYASRNIQVNAVAPGFIDTAMSQAIPPKEREMLIKAIPMERLGAPEDIANVVTFLASDRAAYITGQVLVVDGGGGLDLGVDDNGGHGGSLVLEALWL